MAPVRTLNEELMRLESLHARLRTKRSLTKVNDMLHCLLHLSGEGGAKGAPAQASNILGSVFQAKTTNKLDYGPKAAKPLKDVDMKQPGPLSAK
jgi:hypothetical protein